MIFDYLIIECQGTCNTFWSKRISNWNEVLFETDSVFGNTKKEALETFDVNSELNDFIENRK